MFSPLSLQKVPEVLVMSHNPYKPHTEHRQVRSTLCEGISCTTSVTVGIGQQPRLLFQLLFYCMVLTNTVLESLQSLLCVLSAKTLNVSAQAGIARRINTAALNSAFWERCS